MAVSSRKSFLGVVGLTCVVLVLGLLVINRTHSYDKHGQSVGHGSNVFPGFKLDTTIASVPQVRMMRLTSGDEADPVRSGGTSDSAPRARMMRLTSGDEADPVRSGGTSASVPRARMMRLTSGDEADPVRSGGTSASVPRLVSTSGNGADPVLSGGTSNSTSSTPATAKLATVHTGAGGNNSGELSHLSSPVIEHNYRSTESGVSIFNDSYLCFIEINEQLTSNTEKYTQLSYFSALWNLRIVEPWIASGTCQLSSIRPADKNDMLFFDVYNKTEVESRLTQCFKKFSPANILRDIHFYSANDALVHSSRDVLIIRFMTSQWSTKDAGECGAISGGTVRQVLGALNSRVQNVKEAQKVHGQNFNFRVWRTVCITSIPRVRFSVKDANTFIQSELAVKRRETNTGATVVISKWMKVKNITSEVYYYDPNFNLDFNSCEHLPYSDLVLNAVQLMLNGLQIQYPFLGVYVRTERLAIKARKQGYSKNCLNEFHETFEMIKKKYGIQQSHVFLVHDAGKYGSATLSGGLLQISKTILAKLMSWKLQTVHYDPEKYRDLPQHRAFVASVEQTFLSHSHVLLTMGGGGFMSRLVRRFSEVATSDRAYQICKEIF